MTQIIETIDIDAPLSVVYNQWTQFEEFPKILDRIESLSQDTDTHTTWKVRVAGQVREFATEITEQHPDERVAWTSTGGQVDHAGVVTFHKLNESTTRVAAQIDWNPDSLVEKLGAAVGVDDHAVKAELGKFKDYIEARGSADGSWRGDVKA